MYICLYSLHCSTLTGWLEGQGTTLELGLSGQTDEGSRQGWVNIFMDPTRQAKGCISLLWEAVHKEH